MTRDTVYPKPLAGPAKYPVLDLSPLQDGRYSVWYSKYHHDDLCINERVELFLLYHSSKAKNTVDSREASGEGRKRREFIISSRAKHACITWTARGLSQMQNSMRHKSLHECLVSANDVMWRYVMEHFASPGNIDFAAEDLMCSSMKQCLQSVNHEQFPMQMTQNNKNNKWLEILDFQPKLLWRTPTKN